MTMKSKLRNRVAGALAAGLLAATALTAATVVTPAISQTSQTEQVQALAPQAGFADLVEKVMPAVFSVEVRFANTAADDGPRMQGMPELPEGSPFRRFFEFPFGERDGVPQMRPQQPRGGMAQGSGFFISADGYAVTNNHVVRNADQVTIKLSNNGEYKAKVIGTDAKTDLALLKVDDDKPFNYVTFAKAPPRVGQWVIAVGNPFGLGGTVTTGVVSAMGRDIGSGPYDEFIQIDASINHGNSGGPAFNTDGEVIGVNTAIYSPSGGSVGIGFAIPAAVTQDVIASLKDKGTVTRGWLGVQIQPVTADIADTLGLKEAKGAIIADVTDNSPAQKAGLRTGDTILKLNGEVVADSRDLARKVARLAPQQQADVEIMRGGKTEMVKVEIGNMPADPQMAATGQGELDRDSTGRLGLRLSQAEDGAGVRVVDVDPNGAAAKTGIRTGDIILEVSGKVVQSPAEVRDAVAAAAGKKVLLLVKSGNSQRFVAVNLDRG
jgi:serine protease Do